MRMILEQLETIAETAKENGTINHNDKIEEHLNPEQIKVVSKNLEELKILSDLRKKQEKEAQNLEDDDETTEESQEEDEEFSNEELSESDLEKKNEEIDDINEESIEEQIKGLEKEMKSESDSSNEKPIIKSKKNIRKRLRREY